MAAAKPGQIIAVDVGNTRIKFGLFQQTQRELPTPLVLDACIHADARASLATFLRWLHEQDFRPDALTVIAGSDPDVRDELLAEWPAGLRSPRVIRDYNDVPVPVDVEQPARVGIDRLLNALAAVLHAPHPQASIIVDSGTATTIDLVTSDGIFRGGTILPGLRLSAYAMHDYTARLPLLNTDDDTMNSPVLPGRNTEAAMKAGLFYGQLGAVREIAGRLAVASQQIYSEHTIPLLYITGGGGRQMVSCLPESRFVDSLALHGLASLASAEAC